MNSIKEPEITSYSGKFVLRLPRELHKKLRTSAVKSGVSLNQFCLQLLSQRGRAQTDLSSRLGNSLSYEWLEKMQRSFQERFEKSFIGILLFGSVARGEQRSTSDLDLMIVVRNELKLRPALYRWWDENQIGATKVSPHFVHLPEIGESEVGGLWLESAMDGDILIDSDHILEKKLKLLRDEVAEGNYTRKWSHGHPYWIKREGKVSAE